MTYDVLNFMKPTLAWWHPKNDFILGRVPAITITTWREVPTIARRRRHDIDHRTPEKQSTDTTEMTVKRRFRWLLPKTMDDLLVLMLFDGPEMLFDISEIQYQHYYLEVLRKSKASAILPFQWWGP